MDSEYYIGHYNHRKSKIIKKCNISVKYRKYTSTENVPKLWNSASIHNIIIFCSDYYKNCILIL